MIVDSQVNKALLSKTRAIHEQELTSGVFPATSMPDNYWWSSLWPNPSEILHQLGLSDNMIALDLCCGSGYFTLPLAKIVGGRVYALDINPDLIEHAIIEAGRQGVSSIKWITADARQMAELITEKVDYVILANTLHGVPDQPMFVRAVAEVLKPRGLFVVVNWHPLPREHTTVLQQPRGPKTELRMPPEAVKTVVEPAGFRLLHIAELPPYHYGAIFERIMINSSAFKGIDSGAKWNRLAKQPSPIRPGIQEGSI